MRIEQGGGYLDKLLDSELSSRDLESRDRRLLMELATGVVRWRSRLDWVLAGFYRGDYDEVHPVVRNAMRVALYQLFFLDRIPDSAAVNESVGLVKRMEGAKAASLVNGVLRSIIRRAGSISWPDRAADEAGYLSVMHSHPRWMVERWIERFGPEETEDLLAANNRRPGLALRVNPLGTTIANVRAQLEQEGIHTTQSRFDSGVLRSNSLGSIADHHLFRSGAVTVQDEAAVLASRITDVRPGMEVIDLCAAPGGKTTAMAEMMYGMGRIRAVDRHERRVKAVEEAARRLGVDAITETIVGDARSMDGPPADVVLVDAPCSGLGVIDRKPDIKWTRSIEDIHRTVSLASEILDNAANLVKPGGRLVYSTCTIEPEENDDVVSSFIERHPEYSLTPLPRSIPQEARDGLYLRTYPHRHGIDGAFGAVLTRSSSD